MRMLFLWTARVSLSRSFPIAPHRGLARAQGVPVVFCLQRRKLGRPLGITPRPRGISVTIFLRAPRPLRGIGPAAWRAEQRLVLVVGMGFLYLGRTKFNVFQPAVQFSKESGF